MRRRVPPALKAATVAICAALCLAGCGKQPPQQPPARPAMWIVSDDDSKIYLLGTMHALPRAMDWKGGAVATALAEAETLVLELTPTEASQAAEVFAELSPRHTPISIEQRLPAEALAALRGRPKAEQALFSDKLDDWAIMVLLGQLAAQEAKLKPDFGVEAGLKLHFQDQQKQIIGLETARAQLTMFETLPLSTQRQLLTNAVLKAGSSNNQVKLLLKAWAQGDVAALEARINEDVQNFPEAYKALISDRNQRWAAWSTERMDQPGTILIAVGAGHMVGAQGLPTLLANAGFTVQRVQ